VPPFGLGTTPRDGDYDDNDKENDDNNDDNNDDIDV
jgi:hypothetical protein